MTTRQESKLGSFHGLKSLFEENISIVSKLPALQAVAVELSDKVGLIRQTISLEAEDITGHTGDKSVKRKELIKSALIISRLVFAYASTIGNLPLKSAMNFTKSKLKKIADDELGSVCSLIHEKATAIVNELVPYGISNESLDAFKAQIAAYVQQVQTPRVAGKARSSYSITLKNLFKQCSLLLEERADSIILSLQDTYPHFFNMYQSLRLLVNPAVSNSRVTGIIIDKDSGEPLNGVVISAAKNGFATSSKKGGEYKLIIPKPGDYTIEFSKPGFKTFVKSEVTVVKGQNTRLEVEMGRE